MYNYFCINHIWEEAVVNPKGELWCTSGRKFSQDCHIVGLAPEREGKPVPWTTVASKAESLHPMAGWLILEERGRRINTGSRVSVQTTTFPIANVTPDGRRTLDGKNLPRGLIRSILETAETLSGFGEWLYKAWPDPYATILYHNQNAAIVHFRAERLIHIFTKQKPSGLIWTLSSPHWSARRLTNFIVEMRPFTCEDELLLTTREVVVTNAAGDTRVKRKLYSVDAITAETRDLSAGLKSVFEGENLWLAAKTVAPPGITRQKLYRLNLKTGKGEAMQQSISTLLVA